MNLKHRVSHLQQQIERSLNEGASQGDVNMYESIIAELLRINEWIMEQCEENNRIYFEEDGKKYMLFKNTTGIDFRFVSMKAKIINSGDVVDTYEVTAVNWKAGKWQRLYFDAELKDNDTIEIDANSVEYQVAKKGIYT